MAKYTKPKLDENTFYFPHGGMCLSCLRVHHDCSHYDFKAMKPIIQYYDEDNSAAVKCQHHEKPYDTLLCDPVPPHPDTGVAQAFAKKFGHE